ncbi:MAG: baseplate J/gp47 family protein [Oscillospiraceae bacterium]|nr:baseplate J/gp47 family protein [Oscillospiraceae bacterium]
MKTANEIFEEMKAVFEEKSGYAVSDGCDMAVRMYAAAAQTEALYIYADWTLRQSFPQSAEGQYLDSHALARGIVRKEGSKAAGELVFFVNSAAVNDILIPAGTVCMTADGVSFVTLDSSIIPEGEKICTVKAQALSVGTQGNAAKRTVNYMTDAPGGVEGCTNTYAFTGGEDEESDDELRARIMDSYRGLSNGANAAWYKKKALEVDGVAAATVVPCARGVGTVDVIITAEDGVPSAELIANVQSALEAEREICVDVSVYAPETVSLSIAAEVKVKAGYEPSAVLQNVKTSLEEMFGGGILGRKVYCAEICDRIYHTEGVESYRLTAPDFDYAAPENVLLCAGTISVGRWE